MNYEKEIEILQKERERLKTRYKYGLQLSNDINEEIAKIEDQIKLIQIERFRK